MLLGGIVWTYPTRRENLQSVFITLQHQQHTGEENPAWKM